MTTQAIEDQLSHLANHRSENAVSLVLPTIQSGSEVQQNAIRYKNLLRDVEHLLHRRGVTTGESKQLLRRLEHRQRDDSFWQHQTRGLAIFVDGQDETLISLQRRPEQVAYVGETFHLTAVALDASLRQSFSVLTLAWDAAQLFSFDGLRLEPHASDLFPVAMHDILLPADAEAQLQFRSQPRGDAEGMFHGQAKKESVVSSDRRHFLREVAKRVERQLDSDRDRLLVVATGEVRAEWEATCQLKPLQGVAASPDSLSPQELHARVTSVAESLARPTGVAESLAESTAAGRATHGLAETLAAASVGRVERLIVDSSQPRWGTWDPEIAELTLGERDESVDLLNLAVVYTLGAGGSVVEATDAPLDSPPIAAILRY